MFNIIDSADTLISKETLVESNILFLKENIIDNFVLRG